MIELDNIEYSIVVIVMMVSILSVIFILRWYATGYEEDETDEGDSGGEG
jgi:hypothetical protein